jgi:hypothetical protein
MGGVAEDAMVLLSLEHDALGFEPYGDSALQLRVPRAAATERRWVAVEPADVHCI